MRCPRCLELLKEHIEDGVIIDYCGNENCIVADGVYEDRSNLLGYGKGKFVVHLPTHEKFMKEAEDRFFEAVFKEEEIKKEASKEATYWQDKYYNTLDFKVVTKIKDWWERLIKKKQVIKYNNDSTKSKK